MTNKIRNKTVIAKVTEREKKFILRKAKKFSNGNTSEFIRSCVNFFLIKKGELKDGTNNNT